MDARIAAARARLGTDVVLLGHHYQRDEVIRFADFTGDSYKLSKVAAETDAKYMIFCGVHFMAETADVLGQPWQQVILPDLNAGCSMADMAEIGQVEDCWDSLERAGVTDEASGGLIPLTYMNSAAAIKAFCGERGGLVCTSSNARGAFEWAFARAGKILFLPRPAPRTQHRLCDGHSARGDGRLGPVSDQRRGNARASEGCEDHPLEGALLGPSALSARARRSHPPRRAGDAGRRSSRVPLGGLPEGRLHRLDRKDYRRDRKGSRRLELCRRHGDPPGQSSGEAFAPLGKRVITLDDSGCLCTTMYRISPQHLAWALENLVEGRVVNRIKVDDDVKQWARVALDRMLEVSTGKAGV